MEKILEMRLFVLVAREGSLSAAARTMGLSPASVSRYIGRLEDSLGAQLFNRSNRRKVSLTQAGEAFLDRVTHVLRDIDELANVVLELEGEAQGILHIYSRLVIGYQLVLPVVNEFRQKYPKIHLVFTLSDDPVDLIERNVDIVLTGSLSQAGTLKSRTLARCRRILCASPEYLERNGRPKTVDDLASFDCVTYRPDLTEPVWRFRVGGQERLIRPKSTVWCNNGVALRSLALHGVGIAMLPEWLVSEDLTGGQLVEVLSPLDSASSTWADFDVYCYALVQSTRYRSPRVQAFLDFMFEALAGWR